jgi:predicted dehydrogenase
VVSYYNKGLLNNGSHMLDLLMLLLGPLKIVMVGKSVNDYSTDDPTIPVWLKAANDLPIHVACGHAADFTLSELQLVFASAVITMEQGGLVWRERAVVSSKTFAGYRVPSNGVRRSGGYPRAMLRAVDNICGAVQHGHPLASTGDSALATQRLCEQIRHHEK